jgi:hypothetical protein
MSFSWKARCRASKVPLNGPENLKKTNKAVHDIGVLQVPAKRDNFKNGMGFS